MQLIKNTKAHKLIERSVRKAPLIIKAGSKIISKVGNLIKKNLSIFLIRIKFNII